MGMVEVTVEGGVATVTLNRPEKGNAVSEALIDEIGGFFDAPPEGVRVAILAGAGAHFCAGLDLAEHVERSPEENIHISRKWHRVLDQVQFGGLPVVAALQGAVIGGGLEIAAAAHVRVAEPSCIFQLPEGRRGIFVGGGATVRIGRIIGADRLTEMMLTGRRYGAEDAVRLGLAHYAVGEGEAAVRARELAERIAQNAPLSNYMMIQAISRIDDMGRADGFFTEALASALAQSTPDASEGLRAFLEKRAPKFR